MALEFDFIGANDKPALIAVNNPEWLSVSQTVLGELGYKVRMVGQCSDFVTRFAEIPFQVLIIDEVFNAASPQDNMTLATLQAMPMAQRRHTTVFLLGSSFETLNSLQAFQQSVHAVVNYSEVALLAQIVQKVVAENDLFLKIYRDTQRRLVQMSGEGLG